MKRRPKRSLRLRLPVPADPLRPPTPRQGAFAHAVRDLDAGGDRAPTAALVARAMGITRKGARLQLRALMRKGLVKPVPITVIAGWRLTEAGEAWAAANAATPDPIDADPIEARRELYGPCAECGLLQPCDCV